MLQVAGNVAIDKPVLQAVDEHFHIGKDKSGSGLQGGAAVKPSGEEDEYADIATFEDENILENDEVSRESGQPFAVPLRSAFSSEIAHNGW